MAVRCAAALLAGGLAAAVSAATFGPMSWAEAPAQAAWPSQVRWAAADPGSGPAVKNGWLPDGSPGLWVINSIGVLRHDGQRLLVAVLSSGQPTEAGGISQVQAPPPRRRPQSPSQRAQPGHADLAREGQEETESARCGSFQFGRT